MCEYLFKLNKKQLLLPRNNNNNDAIDTHYRSHGRSGPLQSLTLTEGTNDINAVADFTQKQDMTQPNIISVIFINDSLATQRRNYCYYGEKKGFTAAPPPCILQRNLSCSPFQSRGFNTISG